MAMTPEEIEAIKKRNKILGNRIQRYLKAEPEDKKRYWLSYWQAQRELVRINQPLIKNETRKIARKLPYKNNEEFEANVEEIRYISEDAAMRAATDLNPEKGEYSTYFKKCLKSRTKMHFSREMRRLGTIPYPVAQRYKEIDIVESKLTHQLEREPTSREIIQELEDTNRNDKKLGKINDYHLDWLRIAKRPVFDSGLGGKKDKKYVIVSDKSPNPQNYLIQEEGRKQITELVNDGILDEREKTIIRGRFGLPSPRRQYIDRLFGLEPGYREPSTLNLLGNRLGLTREGVRQIELRALKKLRTAIEEKGYTLESFF